MEEQAPRSWVGQRVEMGLLEAERLDEYNLPHGLTEQYRDGMLEAVNDLGIVASLSIVASLDLGPEDEEKPTSTFYPWSAVLWLRLPVGES